MPSRSIAVVTDSTAYMPPELLEQYGIFVVPNVVNWGTQTYRDGVDIQSKAFFERLKTDPVRPTTAVASIGEFHDIYAKAAQEAEAVVGVHLSAKLSGTYSAAVQAAKMLAGKRIEVIDSNATAMAMGFVVLAAARAAEAGQSVEQVVQAARDTIPHVGVVFTVETLRIPAPRRPHRGCRGLCGQPAGYETDPGSARWAGGADRAGADQAQGGRPRYGYHCRAHQRQEPDPPGHAAR